MIARLEDKTSQITASMRQLEQRYLRLGHPPSSFATFHPKPTAHLSLFSHKATRGIRLGQGFFSLFSRMYFCFGLLCLLHGSKLLCIRWIHVNVPFCSIFLRGLLLAISYGSTCYIKQRHKQKSWKYELSLWWNDPGWFPCTLTIISFVILHPKSSFLNQHFSCFLELGPCAQPRE